MKDAEYKLIQYLGFDLILAVFLEGDELESGR
jgi:hypothetical protein